MNIVPSAGSYPNSPGALTLQRLVQWFVGLWKRLA